MRKRKHNEFWEKCKEKISKWREDFIGDSKIKKVMLITALILFCTLVFLLFITKMNLVPVLKKIYIPQITMVTCTVCLVVLIICLQKTSILLALAFNLALYLFLLSILGVTNIFSKNSGVGITLLIILYVTLLVNLFLTAYQISVQKTPEKMEFKNIKDKNSVNYKVTDAISTLIYKAEILFYKINFFTVPILFILLIMATVFTFASVYDQFNNFNKGVEGLYYSSSSGTSIPVMAKDWDTLYFSSATFFTVGYGDILPVGKTIKLVAQLEMLMCYVLNILLMPIIFNFVISKFNRLKSSESEPKKV